MLRSAIRYKTRKLYLRACARLCIRPTNCSTNARGKPSPVRPLTFLLKSLFSSKNNYCINHNQFCKSNKRINKFNKELSNHKNQKFSQSNRNSQSNPSYLSPILSDINTSKTSFESITCKAYQRNLHVSKFKRSKQKSTRT